MHHVTASAKWKNSSWCTEASGNRVEVASVDGSFAVSDSKDRKGPAFVFTADGWQAFVKGR